MLWGQSLQMSLVAFFFAGLVTAAQRRRALFLAKRSDGIIAQLAYSKS